MGMQALANASMVDVQLLGIPVSQGISVAIKQLKPILEPIQVHAKWYGTKVATTSQTPLSLVELAL